MIGDLLNSGDNPIKAQKFGMPSTKAIVFIVIVVIIGALALRWLAGSLKIIDGRPALTGSDPIIPGSTNIAADELSQERNESNHPGALTYPSHPQFSSSDGARMAEMSAPMPTETRSDALSDTERHTGALTQDHTPYRLATPIRSATSTPRATDGAKLLGNNLLSMAPISSTVADMHPSESDNSASTDAATYKLTHGQSPSADDAPPASLVVPMPITIDEAKQRLRVINRKLSALLLPVGDYPALVVYRGIMLSPGQVKGHIDILNPDNPGAFSRFYADVSAADVSNQDNDHFAKPGSRSASIAFMMRVLSYGGEVVLDLIIEGLNVHFDLGGYTQMQEDEAMMSIFKICTEVESDSYGLPLAPFEDKDLGASIRHVQQLYGRLLGNYRGNTRDCTQSALLALDAQIAIGLSLDTIKNIYGSSKIADKPAAVSLVGVNFFQEEAPVDLIDQIIKQSKNFLKREFLPKEKDPIDARDRITQLYEKIKFAHNSMEKLSDVPATHANYQQALSLERMMHREQINNRCQLINEVLSIRSQPIHKCVMELYADEHSDEQPYLLDENQINIIEQIGNLDGHMQANNFRDFIDGLRREHMKLPTWTENSTSSGGLLEGNLLSAKGA